MHLRSVPLREFQEKINQVDDEYDILRIFLADKDLSNEAIRQILMSRNDDEPVEIKKKRTESTDEFEDDDYEDSDPSSYMDGEYDGYLNDENRRSDRLLEGLYILTVLEDLSRRPLILWYSTFIRFAYSNFAIGPLHENRWTRDTVLSRTGMENPFHPRDSLVFKTSFAVHRKVMYLKISLQFLASFLPA